MTEHKFPWKWYLSNLANIPKNGLKVFSCFSCGGGSSMGYKLAGYDVIGNVEIDPRVMEVYKRNLHPQYPFLMDIRDFLNIPNSELPEELFNLDILDGSPPCSVFSIAGQREKAWNKEKVFREGQQKQKLDDLFFYFINVARKLQPKVIIAENVSGLLKGNARGYVNLILKSFNDAGYDVHLFLLNSAFMGVPQRRERCFFVAHRKDLCVSKLILCFNENYIPFKQVRSVSGEAFQNKESIIRNLLLKRMSGDRCINDISLRVRNKQGGFNHAIIHDEDVASTLIATGLMFRMCDGLKVSKQDMIAISTFPQDYEFLNQSVKYVCGMSVPPVMMAQVASAVYEQWFKGDESCQSEK